jgi:hypothetical protein
MLAKERAKRSHKQREAMMSQNTYDATVAFTLFLIVIPATWVFLWAFVQWVKRCT